jgi:tRNA-dihydrouridine synthase
MNVWHELDKPLLALAPMDDVTDTVFRRIVAECAPPDVYFTEFASADGLQSAGRERVLDKLKFTSKETPLIAQLWGMKPENYQTTAEEIAGMGFAGIDINMGCPVPKIVKIGACAALMKNRSLAADIIAAAKAGAGNLPVSVKTRVGYERPEETWTQFLLEQKLDALIVHGRTAKQVSKVPNNWDLVERVRVQRDSLSPNTVMVGNGDVANRPHALKLAKKYRLDGIMIGRGVLKEPFAFSESSPWPEYDRSARLALFAEHIKLFEQTWGTGRNPATLKKFAKLYVNGFAGAVELRTRLMAANTAADLLSALAKV